MNLDQEKRVMIAFGLSIVMLILYRVYFVKEQPPEPKKVAQPVAATTASRSQERPQRRPPLPPHRRLHPRRSRYCKVRSPKTLWWKASSTA